VSFASTATQLGLAATGGEKAKVHHYLETAMEVIYSFIL